MAGRTIAILGGGISGITTGTLLNVLGCDTVLYTPHRADEEPSERPLPEFASLFPAASAIPHSVTIRDLAWHLEASAAFFETLCGLPGWGVRQQPHFEVFEQPPEEPDYAPLMPNFRRLPPGGEGVPEAPRRTEAAALYGWQFDCFFAEMPCYLPQLYRLYEATGGRIVRRRVRRCDFGALGAAALVNCTGRWAPQLVDDPAPCCVLRGHLVYVDVPRPALSRHTGRRFSYNYVPEPSVYHTAGGEAADCYFYPRGDAWALGGTRQVGFPAIGGAWEGEETAVPTVQVGPHAVPEPLLTVNRELLLDLTGIDILEYPRRARLGYRFARDLGGEGVRLEVTEEAGVPVAHNYGHGGAGVALSWSCALRVAQLLGRAVDLRPAFHSIPDEARPAARRLRTAAHQSVKA